MSEISNQFIAQQYCAGVWMLEHVIGISKFSLFRCICCLNAACLRMFTLQNDSNAFDDSKHTMLERNKRLSIVSCLVQVFQLQQTRMLFSNVILQAFHPVSILKIHYLKVVCNYATRKLHFLVLMMPMPLKVYEIQIDIMTQFYIKLT